MSSTSSSFELEDDSTSHLSRDKINFDPPIFENYLSDVIYNLDSVNSADFEDSLHEFKLEESNLKVEFETFIMPHAEDAMFIYDLNTSSFLKEIIETSSINTRAKSNENVTSFDKYSSRCFFSKP